MLEFNVSSDLDKLQSKLDDLASKQVPFAISLALNQTAQYAKDNLFSAMRRIFDRPKPYTLNSLYIKPSNKSNLSVTVGHKPGSPVNQYVAAEIEGGQRFAKHFESVLRYGEYLVPGQGIKLDAYGNPSRAMVMQIIAALKSGNGTPGNNGIFIVRPGAFSKLRPGIYQRYGRTVKIKGKRGHKEAIQTDGHVRALFLFVTKTTYRAIYDVEGIVTRVYEAEFGKQFAAMMDYALATAKVRL
jgi:hypothetical protein